MESSPRQNGSQFYTHRLANGLQMVGEFMPSVESASSCFYVDTGSRDEPAELMGVSHFLEHMMFKGTATRDYRAINHAFEEMGAENNAGTWIEFTYYWAKVLGDQLPLLTELLADMMRPRLAAEDFEQERSVILEEIARYDDMPHAKLFEHLMLEYYGADPLAYRVLGTRDSIGALRLEAMQAYHARRYVPQNITFSVAGRFDWPAVVDQVTALTAAWPVGEGGRTATAPLTRSGRRVIQQADLQQQLLVVASAGIGRADPDRYTADVLATILGDDAGSRYFWAVREEGLAESVDADVMMFSGTGMTLSTATTSPDLAVRCLAAMQNELARLQHDGVTTAELERAKVKLASRVVMDGESTNRRMLALVDAWLTYGRLETLQDVVDRIDAVSVEGIRAYLDRRPLTADQVVVALGPMDEAELAATT